MTAKDEAIHRLMLLLASQNFTTAVTPLGITGVENLGRDIPTSEQRDVALVLLKADAALRENS